MARITKQEWPSKTRLLSKGTTWRRKLLVTMAVFAFSAPQHDPFFFSITRQQQRKAAARTSSIGIATAFVVLTKASPRSAALLKPSRRIVLTTRSQLDLAPLPWNEVAAASDPSSCQMVADATMMACTTTSSSLLPSATMPSAYWWLLLASAVTTRNSAALMTLASVPLVTFVTMIAQGAAAILHFRRHYADAPLPQVPCHGLVVADNNDKNQNKNNYKPALRLLVLGDSLAVGVGQAASGTPVLPETVARVLATTTQRPVLWTCSGETGASTALILQRLRQRPAFLGIMEDSDKDKDGQVKPKHKEGHRRRHHCTKDSNQHSQQHRQAWEERLDQYQQSFEDLYRNVDTWEPFDVVLFITGANDMKSAYFPFLLAPDERDEALRESSTGNATASTRGATNQSKDALVTDLQAFVDVLSDKMEQGRESARQDALIVCASAPRPMEIHQESETLVVPSGERDVLYQTNGNTTAITQMDPDTSSINMLQATATSTVTSPMMNENVADPVLIPEPNATTLFVLPAMPTRIVPAMQQPPMAWFARSVFEGLNKKKQDLASTRSDHILFVDEPSKEEIKELVDQKGKLWQNKQQEKILLSLQSIDPDDCKGIRATMKDFYNKSQVLFDIPDQNGVAAFFSPDTIHPTERGYDMWGRHIGLEIAEKLESERKT